MRNVKLVGATILAVLIIILVVQNTEAVETRLLFITVTMPRAALLLVTWLAGVAVGLVVALTVSGPGRRRS